MAIITSILNCDADASVTTSARERDGARTGVDSALSRGAGAAPGQGPSMVLATSPHADLLLRSHVDNLEARRERILAIRSARISAPAPTGDREPLFKGKGCTIEAILAAAKF